MTFSKSGELDVVTCITGPHHHYLAVQLEPEGDRSFVDVECVSPDRLVGSVDPTRADEVRMEVSLSIDTANKQLATRYRAFRIRIGTSDAPVKDVYRSMAERLVEHMRELQGQIAPAKMR